MPETKEKRMTLEELQKHMQDNLVPLIKDYVSKDVKDLVEDRISKLKRPEDEDLPEKVFGNVGKVADKILTDEMGAPKLDKERREPGSAFGAYARYLCRAKGEVEGAAVLAKRAGDDDIATIIDHAVKHGIYIDGSRKDMSAGNFEEGGSLVPIQFSTDFIELLRPRATMRMFGVPSVPTPTGSVRISKLTEGVTAYYIGELENIPVSSPKTGQITLSFKKLAAVIPMSNDLVRYSSPGADAIVRNDAIRALAQREDQAFIRNDGTDATPKGLRYWVDSANVFDSVGTSLANTATDLGTAMEKLMEANVEIMRGAWLMAPRAWRYLTTIQTTTGAYAYRDEMMNGNLWGWPYKVTTQVPRNLGSGGNESEIYFFEVENCIIGEGMTMQLDASNVAAYDDGGTVKASFSRDETVVRVIEEHDFAMRHPKACAVITAVTYGN